MTDSPAFLRTRSCSVFPADNRTVENLGNESFAGECTDDADFRRLRTIREVTKTRTDKKKNTVVLLM